MATKDNYLSFKATQNVFVQSDNQYNNLNLNQNYQCSVYNIACPKDFTIESRKVQNNDFSRINDLRSKKGTNLWKKPNNFLSATFLNLNYPSEGNDEFEKATSANNSTLSLHIAAYENAIEADSTEKESVQKMDKTIGFLKQWGTLKHFVDGSTSIIQNTFGFPRQQEDQESRRPELMQFSASQRLLNPNQMDANTQAKPSEENSAVEQPFNRPVYHRDDFGKWEKVKMTLDDAILSRNVLDDNTSDEFSTRSIRSLISMGCKRIASYWDADLSTAAALNSTTHSLGRYLDACYARWDNIEVNREIIAPSKRPFYGPIHQQRESDVEPVINNPFKNGGEPEEIEYMEVDEA